ncbi:hypothetical protein [Chitinophaga caseinilytica]|uniref:DUF304 domain-containing protein n=1 Tax=Chitinophaga caseinilytica TaxID=2267521 RepID=A0ABZ2Z080_9BACT
MKTHSIITTELTSEEKRRMRGVFRARILVFLLLILPLAGGLGFIVYQAVMSFVDGRPDFFSYAVPLAFAGLCFGAARYIYPYYRNLAGYAGAERKEIVEATVESISRRSFRAGVVLFTLKTEHGVIDTGVDVVIFPDLGFGDMREGMKIVIHRVPGMRNELLRISAKGK